MAQKVSQIEKTAILSSLTKDEKQSVQKKLTFSKIKLKKPCGNEKENIKFIS